MPHRIVKLALALVTLSVLLPGSAPPAAAQAAPRPRYFVIDLGRPGDARSSAARINADGQVAGYFIQGGRTVAFLWDRRRPWGAERETLGALPGYDNSEPLGINDDGAVVGVSYQTGSGNQRAFVKVPGQLMGEVDLGPGSSRATGINNRGWVVGTAASIGVNRAILKLPDQPPLDLGTLGVPTGDSLSGGINFVGEVVGTSRVPIAIGIYHAFRRNVNQPMQDLGTLGGSRVSFASAINDLNGGQVVGNSATAGLQGPFHAFLKLPDQAMQDLGTLPGTTVSNAFGINNQAINGRGQVVGASWNVNAATGRPVNQRAFLWEDGKGMQDLNDLIPPGSQWLLEEARGINDRGEIVGHGTRNGETRAFLLEPVPAPRARVVPGAPRRAGRVEFTLRTDDASLDVTADIALSGDPRAKANALQQAVNSLQLPDWRAVRVDAESTETVTPYLWFEHLDPTTNLWDIVAEISDWRDTTSGATSFQVWRVRDETDPAAGAVFSFGIGGDPAAGGAGATAFTVLPGHATASIEITTGALPNELVAGLQTQLGQADLIVQSTSPTSFTIAVLPGAANTEPELLFGAADDALWVQGAGIQVVPPVNSATLARRPGNLRRHQLELPGPTLR